MTRCLVIGHRGMLGSWLVSHPPASGPLASLQLTGVDIPEIDITDGDSVLSVFAELRPDVVINCAAYTDVDGAETHRDSAFLVNAAGPELLARAAGRFRSLLVHISTDFVFDGEKDGPYVEDDPTHPLSVYGKSKLAGEQAVIAVAPKHLVVRTAWLYGPNGRNFVDTILAAARKTRHLRVVTDQRGSPTFTGVLAAALWRLIAGGAAGLYHVAGRGACTWFDLARDALAIARVPAQLEAVTTAEFPRAAPRPRNSVLNCAKAEALLADQLPPWQAGLEWHLTGATL